MKIAVIAPMEPSAFFELLWQGVWEATFDVSPFGVEVQNLTTDGYDVNAQRDILTGLLCEPIDAIVLIPAHESAVNDLIEKYVARGTPVITFHSDAPQSRRTLFVGPDALQSGVLAGEVLAKLMGGCGRVLSFPGALQQAHLAQRHQGFRLELGRHFGRLEEVGCAPGGESPQNAAELLAGSGPVDGIYVGSELVTHVAQAIEELGLRVPCVGFTSTEEVQPFLERGIVSAIVDESRYQQGYFAIQKAYEVIVKSGSSTPNGVLIPSSVVFASNMRDGGSGQSLTEAFEGLVLQRTENLRIYQRMLEEANAKLENLATIDPLTELFNRRKFEEILGDEIARAQRNGPISLLMIDLNWFKIVNDRHGHLAGDEALKTVAQVLKSRCRATDLCARLGGDEFAVILPHTDASGAAVLREAINNRIAQTQLKAGNHCLTLSLSIGIATLVDQTTAKELLAIADRDMYRVKSATKGSSNSGYVDQSVESPAASACRLLSGQ